MSNERQTELNGHKIAFPSVTKFAELFPTVKPAEGDAPRLLTTESWECGTWSDKGRKTRSYTSGFLSFSATPHRKALHVTAAPEVLEYIKANMLAVPWDTKFFEIVIWDDGEALVICKFNQISGGHYLAIIDAASIPEVERM